MCLLVVRERPEVSCEYSVEIIRWNWGRLTSQVEKSTDRPEFSREGRPCEVGRPGLLVMYLTCAEIGAHRQRVIGNYVVEEDRHFATFWLVDISLGLQPQISLANIGPISTTVGQVPPSVREIGQFGESLAPVTAVLRRVGRARRDAHRNLARFG